MMRKIISAILAIVMCVSMMGGITVGAENVTTYTYSFIGVDYHSPIPTDGSHKLTYNGLPRYTDYSSATYADGERNWKYHGMDDDVYTNWETAVNNNSANDGRGTAGFDTGGILFIPTEKGDWFTLQFRVPEAGLYKLSYIAPISETKPNNKSLHVGIFSTYYTEKRIEDSNSKTQSSSAFMADNIDLNKSLSESKTDLSYVDIGTHVIPINTDGGEAVISFTTTDSASSTVKQKIRLRGFRLTKVEDELVLGSDKVALEAGGTTATVTASLKNNTTVKTIGAMYEIADTDIATVNGTGVITPVSAGETTLTVTLGDLTKTISVVVSAPAEDEKLKEAFTIDDTDNIEAAVYANKVSALAYVDGAESTDGVTATAAQLSTGAYNMTTTTTNDEYTFLYWVKGLDGGAKKVLSREESFTYTPAGNGANYLIAVYEKDGATANKAEFYDANGLLIKAIEGTTVTAPDLPSMAGYGDAQKWVNKNGEKYDGNTSVDISGTVMFIAEYAEPEADIVVTPLNDSCTVDKEAYVYGGKVVCTPTATENFKAWVKDGEIVSVDAEKYEFYAWENCEVEAIYEAHTPISGVARKILIDLFGNNIMAEYIGFGDAVEKGIILDNTEIAMTSTNTQFTIALDDATSAKGYAVVKNSDGTYTKYIDGSYTKTAE